MTDFDRSTAGRTSGRTRYWCRRCERPLVFDLRHRDTVSVDPAAKHLVFVHDRCGGTVRPSMPAR